MRETESRVNLGNLIWCTSPLEPVSTSHPQSLPWVDAIEIPYRPFKDIQPVYQHPDPSRFHRSLRVSTSRSGIHRVFPLYLWLCLCCPTEEMTVNSVSNFGTFSVKMHLILLFGHSFSTTSIVYSFFDLEVCRWVMGGGIFISSASSTYSGSIPNM